jgi:hypothetical protein
VKRHRLLLDAFHEELTRLAPALHATYVRVLVLGALRGAATHDGAFDVSWTDVVYLTTDDDGGYRVRRERVLAKLARLAHSGHVRVDGLEALGDPGWRRPGARDAPGTRPARARDAPGTRPARARLVIDNVAKLLGCGPKIASSTGDVSLSLGVRESGEKSRKRSSEREAPTPGSSSAPKVKPAKRETPTAPDIAPATVLDFDALVPRRFTGGLSLDRRVTAWLNALGQEPGTSDAKRAFLHAELPRLEAHAFSDLPTKSRDAEAFRVRVRAYVLAWWRQRLKTPERTRDPAADRVRQERESAERHREHELLRRTVEAEVASGARAQAVEEIRRWRKERWGPRAPASDGPEVR